MVKTKAKRNRSGSIYHGVTFRSGWVSVNVMGQHVSGFSDKAVT